MANENNTVDLVARAKEISSRVKSARNTHDLHVLLIMDQEKMTKAQAIVLAYLEGYEGKANRSTRLQSLK